MAYRETGCAGGGDLRGLMTAADVYVCMDIRTLVSFLINQSRSRLELDLSIILFLNERRGDISDLRSY